jgi:hypothetical protein
LEKTNGKLSKIIDKELTWHDFNDPSICKHDVKKEETVIQQDAATTSCKLLIRSQKAI